MDFIISKWFFKKFYKLSTKHITHGQNERYEDPLKSKLRVEEINPHTLSN